MFAILKEVLQVSPGNGRTLILWRISKILVMVFLLTLGVFKYMRLSDDLIKQSQTSLL